MTATRDTQVSVLLGADSLVGPRSGIGRMTAEIANRLATHLGIGAVRLLANGAVHDPSWLRTLAETAGEAPTDGAAPLARMAAHAAEVPGLRTLRNAWRRQALGRAVAPVKASFGRPVVYHETNFVAAPYDGPTAVTVHDLFWHTDPALVPEERRRWIDRNLPRLLRDVDHFVCVSHYTADALRRHLGVPGSRVTIVPEAASRVFRPITAAAARPVLDRLGLGDRSFVLAASTLEPRKNFDRLFAAHARLPEPLRRRVPLVIAGGRGWGTVLAGADRARAAADLRLLGHVPDADLAVLMARAAVFAFVSLKEGFGLPVLEAMAADTPVVASATTATEETAGDGARLVNPENIGEISEALRHLLEDPAEAADLRRRGRLRAGEFSWDRTVDRLVDVWRGLS